MDKSLRKDGAGMHNWGSLKDEYNLERDGFDDEGFEDEELQETKAPNADAQTRVEGSETAKSEPQAAQVTEKDVEQARAFRAKALKGTGTCNTSLSCD